MVSLSLSLCVCVDSEVTNWESAQTGAAGSVRTTGCSEGEGEVVIFVMLYPMW